MEVKIVLNRGELLYDCSNRAYVEADVMEVGQHGRHHLFDISDEGNVDIVGRIMDLTFARCVELCFPYSKKEIEEPERDNALCDDDEYVLSLNIPDGFSETTVRLLNKVVHELMVCRVMEYFVSVAKPERTPFYREKGDLLEADLSAALNARTGRVRRPLAPF